MAVVTDEQFGPVCPVTAFADRTEAVTLVNNGDPMLNAAAFTATTGR